MPVNNTPVDNQPLRASVRELLPYLFQQRKLLIVSLALGLVSSLAALAQPLTVSAIVTAVQNQQPVLSRLSHCSPDWCS